AAPGRYGERAIIQEKGAGVRSDGGRIDAVEDDLGDRRTRVSGAGAAQVVGLDEEGLVRWQPEGHSWRQLAVEERGQRPCDRLPQIVVHIEGAIFRGILFRF